MWLSFWAEECHTKKKDINNYGRKKECIWLKASGIYHFSCGTQRNWSNDSTASVGLEKTFFSHTELLLVNQCFEKPVAMLTQKLLTTQKLNYRKPGYQKSCHKKGLKPAVRVIACLAYGKAWHLVPRACKRKKPLKHHGKVKCLCLESPPSKSRVLSWKKIHHLNQSVTNICKVI